MLKTVLNGVTLKNPVITASGTFGFGQEYDQFFDISRLGGISSKGLTLEERFGNEGERVYETPSGLINSIGLQNPGVDAFIREDLPFLRQKDTAVIANLGGSTIESYLEGVEKLNETDVDMIELNISCPNVKEGGALFGASASGISPTTLVKTPSFIGRLLSIYLRVRRSLGGL